MNVATVKTNQLTKGKFEDLDIREVVKKVHDADIEIIANFLFGLTGDTFDSMQKTLDLSLELCTIAWNAYAVMALPGSGLYKKAVDIGYIDPKLANFFEAAEIGRENGSCLIRL